MKTATIILPTFNERENIRTLIPAIFKIAKRGCPGWTLSVLVVDDRSPDKTAEEVASLQKNFQNLYLLEGKKKAGLGNAYLRGFNYVSEKIRSDVLFEMDADWSHSPDLIPAFLSKLDAGADFVIGSRYIRGGSIPHNWAFHRKLFSTLGNLVIRLGFMKLRIHDWTSGFRAIRTEFITEVLSHMKVYNGYVFQVALLSKAEEMGLTFSEVPLKFVDRKKGESKINSGEYITNTLSYVFRHSSFIKYLIVGIFGFGIDFGMSYILIERWEVAVWLATLFSTETAIVANFILNNFWSFAHKQIERSQLAYFKSFLAFNLVSVGSILIQTVSLHFSTSLFVKDQWPLYKALIIVFLVVPYSYFMYNNFIWKKKSRS